MTTGTERYYAGRAPEYDRVYKKPERQGDIGVLSTFVEDSLSGRCVLDVAAGTAFWTAVLKNIPSRGQLVSRLARHGRCELLELEYYWAVRVVLGGV